MDELVNVISTVGFPAACCVYMIYSNNKTLKELVTAVNSLTSAVKILLHENNDHVHEEGISYVKGETL